MAIETYSVKDLLKIECGPSSATTFTSDYLSPFLLSKERDDLCLIRNIPLSRSSPIQLSAIQLKSELSASSGTDKDKNAGCKLLPLVVNRQPKFWIDKNLAYTVSPFNHFITYGLDELHMYPIFWVVQWLLTGLLWVMALVLQLVKIDRIVMPCNYMLSTSLHSGMNDKEIKSITHYLKEKYSDSAIMIRGVNDAITADLKTRLENQGYKMLVSRVIYWSDPSKPATWKMRSLNQDLKLFYDVVEPFEPYLKLQLPRRSNMVPHQHRYKLLDNELLSTKLQNSNPIERHEILLRCEQVYNMLYLGKYSKCNIQFTWQLFDQFLKKDTWQFRAIENTETGVIDGIIGFYLLDYVSYDTEGMPSTQQRIMTVPLLGYDTSKQDGYLYRLLSCVIAIEGKRNGAILNQSSGASKFKVFRGCSKAFEYFAIYDKHLPWYRKCIWSLMYYLLEFCAKPVVLKYEL